SGPDAGIRLFNARTGRDVALPELSRVCELDGAVWIASQRRLLCRRVQGDGASQPYLLVSLSGAEQAAIDLPAEDGLYAVAYLHGQDAVILTSVASGPLGGNPRNRVWFHDLRNGNSYRMADDQYLGRYVAWAE
ncbi:MAG: hypothetical protein R3358_11350, partial [Woeseiaceae bacterium]|nr:hypothetical protein [Woeseiaceae bacterium]